MTSITSESQSCYTEVKVSAAIQLCRQGNCCSELQLAVLNAIDALFSAAATGTFTSLLPARGLSIRKQRSVRLAPAASGSGAAVIPATSTSSSSPKPAGLGGMLQRVRRSVSKRITSLTAATSSAGGWAGERAGGHALLTTTPQQQPPRPSPQLRCCTAFSHGPNQQHSAHPCLSACLSACPLLPAGASAMECSSTAPTGTPASKAADQQGAAAHPAAALPPIAETAYCLAAPQPPTTLGSWEAAEAWLWDSRTWSSLR